jgi:hypothetical protein
MGSHYTYLIYVILWKGLSSHFILVYQFCVFGPVRIQNFFSDTYLGQDPKLDVQIVHIYETSVAELHHFYAGPCPASSPGKIFYEAPAPAPTPLYSKAKF